MDYSKLVRKSVLEFTPYIPGKPIDEVKRQLKLKRVYKMASNENALGASKKVLARIKEKLNQIHFYPDGSCYYLKSAISKKYRIPQENIFIGSGSDEIIEIIGKTFLNPEDEIIVSEHAFVRFKMAADLMGAKSKIIPMKDFKHDLVSMANAVDEKTKLVFIANPNNPTGTYNSKNELDKYFEILDKKNIMLITVLDEAYFEYATIEKDYPDGLDYFKSRNDLIVIRTFSKMYGLAGLRVGYAFAPREIVDYMDRIRPPFNVNIIAQIAAEIAINDNQQIKRTIKLMKTEKAYLYSELNKMNLKYIPSATNFILIDVSPHTGKKIFDKLLSLGIIVRPMEEYMLPNHIRVTIGTRIENSKFIKALKKCLQ